MKIEFNKKQYETLIKSLETAGSIYGIMGDMVDGKHKKASADIDDLVDYILGFAGEFGLEGLVDEFEGKRYVQEDYKSELMDDIISYDDYAFWDMLVRELAKKELAKRHTRDEAKRMGEEEFMLKLWEMEEKFWKWSEEVGLDGLEVKGFDFNKTK